MCFEINKQVAVIDDVLKGIIIAVEGELIDIQDSEGMVYKFHKNELVVLEESQHELSKYIDINSQLLKEKLTIKKTRSKNLIRHKNEVVFEVDLHVSQLTKSVRGMDNYDILSLQIETARKKIEYAILKRFGKVIFIHGVGEGVLKGELYLLLNKYPVEYYDASYQKYGLGATEVCIL